MNGSVVVSSLIDNDRFLPRFLAVELLKILAKTIPSPANINEAEYSAAAKKFIDSCKYQELFNPLTAKIFWRDNPIAFLSEYTGVLDDLDQYNRSALTMALANEDFVLANELLKKDATIFLEDKLVLEIALTSMLQRDESIKNKILDVAEEHDRGWITEYLEHLIDNLKGVPTKVNNRYSDVLNPTIRQFGQTLDTLVYFNGMPSHYGFIGPSLDTLTLHLKSYAQELANTEIGEHFHQIERAFDFSREACNFIGNIPSNQNAATVINEKIVRNMRQNNQELTIVFGGWAGDCVALGFIKNQLIISNLSTAGDPNNGIKFYTITNPTAVTVDLINNFINGVGYASAPSTILADLAEFIDPQPIFSINPAFNPVDNCIFVNPRAIVQGALLILSSYQKYKSATAENLQSLNIQSIELYNTYVTSLYKIATADLTKFIRNGDLLRNKRVECCCLAVEYINQHYEEPDSLPLCIDLKNALEFAGLKQIYNKNVVPDARLKIQAQIISEQELTAIKVIEQENSMLAKQK